MDAAPVVHATSIRDYKQCPRAYRYRHVLRFVPKGPQARLFVGSGGHAALAAYEQGETDDPAAWFRDWLKDQIEGLGPAASEVPQKVWEECEVVAAVLEQYPEWARGMDDGIQIIVPEQEFRVPVFEPGTDTIRGWHEGRFDGIATTRDGLLWLRERKFLKDFPAEEYLQLDEQAGFYLLAATRLFPDLALRGVLYDVIRKVHPNRAKGELFRRYRVIRGTAELRALEWNLYHSLEQITRDQVWLPAPGHHCMWACPYRALCLAENQGADPAETGGLLFDVEEEETTNGEVEA